MSEKKFPISTGRHHKAFLKYTLRMFKGISFPNYLNPRTKGLFYGPQPVEVR